MDSNKKVLEIKSRIFDFFLSSTDLTQTTFIIHLQKLLKEELQAIEAKVTLESSLNHHRAAFVYEPSVSYISNSLENVVLPLFDRIEAIGRIDLQFRSPGPLSLNHFADISQELSTIFQHYNQYILKRHEEKQFEALYKITSKFHSAMKIDMILSEVIRLLQQLYEDFSYQLLLTADYDNLDHLPIKKLEFDDSNICAMNAYVTGDVQYENSIKDRRTNIYIPVKGAQGVYGVLQIISLDAAILPEAEIKFIKLVADATGSALENTHLYEQSKKVISDLQIINETSHQLNTNLRLSEVTSFMVQEILDAFQAKEAGFILFKGSGTEVLPGSTPFFHNPNIKEHLLHTKNYLYKDGEPLFLGDLRVHENLSNLPFCSCMIIPVLATNGVKGACVVAHPLPYFFSFEQFKLLQSLIHHSTLAFNNSMLREELEQYVITDYLTKLYSRKYLDEKIGKSMQRDTYGTFILVDIDDFKIVNDTYGHQIGDTILVQVANIIKENIRDTDIGARWGGEELAIYLPKIDLQTGESIINRIIEKIREATNPAVTVSCGLSFWSKETKDTPKELFHRADYALYQAKDRGKNQHCSDLTFC
ncbi:Response regulator PleD [Bacillus sp. THAF10]|uniref:diguanylate cyclase domain-containing protein n=1 Tax=Bacillus sp. THAF10 TaxID=2587848 RepID=UPI0012A8AAB8|nr:diguanylate cyclase [Bacillus sp. THAF10]QFT90203.1 Response regulator PleD [Bacillus sp. THAF10]